MTDKELEIEIRRWLEHTLRLGVYDTGVMLALKSLYYKGANEVRQDIKNALQIEDCYHE